MPSFPFFSSKRKERTSRSTFSSTSSSKSAYSSREASPSPEPQPPTFPHFMRRGSEPAAPFTHGQRSRPPPVVLYNANGPSISGRSSAPILTPRRSFDMLSPTFSRQRAVTPTPVISPPRVPSPPLPPHPAAASLSASSRLMAGRAASFNQPRPLRTPPQARPRSRSFGTPGSGGRPSSIASPTSITVLPLASTPPPRPPRPDDLNLNLDACPSPTRRPSIGRKPSLPQLDQVWLAFLEEAEETLDTIGDLPDPNMYDARPARRPTPLVRAITEPPVRVLPPRPDDIIAQQPNPFKHMPTLPESLDSPPTPPHTPAYSRQRMPPISPLDALDVSLSMACTLPSTQSKSSLASGHMSSATSSLSVMSLQDALNYSISLSAFPQPPPLDAVEEEGLDREDPELPYLSHLPTPPVSPDSMVSISRTGTMRARSATPTLTLGRIAIPSFGKIMDASHGLEEAICDDGESSSDESHFTLGTFSPVSSSRIHMHPHRRQFERQDSFSSMSSSLSDMDLADVDEEDPLDEEAEAEAEDYPDSDRSSSRRAEISHSTPRRRSPSPRSSFEFDEPVRTPKDDTLRLAKSGMGMHMELPQMPFVANMDIGPITPRGSDRASLFQQVGWSPANGAVEYGYAV